MSKKIDNKTREELMYERHANFINNMISAGGKIYGNIANKEKNLYDSNAKEHD